MISTGNDIVCLTATNVIRTKSPEFYSKIISPAEKTLFDSLDQAVLPFERFVWLLWSVKESAYKYLQRLDPGIVFTPIKFEVRSINIPSQYSNTESHADEITGCGFNEVTAFNAEVIFAGKKLFTRIIIHREFISSVVNHNEDFNGIYWGIKRIENPSYKFQSTAVRDFALDRFRKISGVDQVAICKNKDDVPVLMNNGELLDTPISLSHHGQWVAFSFKTTAITAN